MKKLIYLLLLLTGLWASLLRVPMRVRTKKEYRYHYEQVIC